MSERCLHVSAASSPALATDTPPAPVAQLSFAYTQAVWILLLRQAMSFQIFGQFAPPRNLDGPIMSPFLPNSAAHATQFPTRLSRSYSNPLLRLTRIHAWYIDESWNRREEKPDTGRGRVRLVG